MNRREFIIGGMTVGAAEIDYVINFSKPEAAE